MTERFDLRAWRFDNGMTIEALAQAAGVSRQTIYRIEEGNVQPTALTAHKLAKVIKRPASELWLEPAA